MSGHPIKEAKIRGVESFGMICSLQEIGLEAKYIPSQFANGIYVLPSDAPVGEDALKYLGLDDVCIELGLTPNRMDLLSMVGVARDVNAIYRQGKIPFMETEEISEKASDLVDVKIASTVAIPIMPSRNQRSPLLSNSVCFRHQTDQQCCRHHQLHPNAFRSASPCLRPSEIGFEDFGQKRF